jgi:hypothetical protein
MKITYILVAVFMQTGQSYIERDGYTLHQCAAEAAMARTDAKALLDRVGEIRFLCIPEIR